MIYNLLQNTLPSEYGISGRNNIHIPIYTVTGLIEQGDNIACESCKAKFYNRATCNEIVMRIDAGENSLIIVDYETYVNQFNGRQIAKGGRCDLLLCDATYNQKIIFCDMGCYSEEYLMKKKAKVHKQTRDSIIRLLNRPSGLAFINLFREKQLIFFRRDSSMNEHPIFPERGDVCKNLQAFVANPATSSARLEADEIVNDIPVKFVIVNYPNIYNW